MKYAKIMELITAETAKRSSRPPEIYWSGTAANSYPMWIFRSDFQFADEPGIYVFAKEDKPDYWIPIYIGQTNSLKTRLGNHEKRLMATLLGATHIHARIEANEATRLRHEADLIARWNPPCNAR